MAKVCKFQILLLEATEKELTKIEKVNDSLHKVKVITEKSGENITKEIKNNRTLTTTIVNKGKEIVNEISDEVTSGRLQKSFKELGTDIKEFGKKAKDKISDFFHFNLTTQHKEQSSKKPDFSGFYFTHHSAPYKSYGRPAYSNLYLFC